MKSSSCIFFDADGTLLDVKKRHYLAHSAACRKFSITPIPIDNYWYLKRNNTPEKYIVTVGPKLFAKYNQQRITLLEDEALLSTDTVFKGIPELLEKLNSKNYIMYVVTVRRHKERVIKQFKKLRINGFFRDILSTPSSNNPDTDKTKLIRSVNISRSYYDCIIGDTEADIICGKKLGLKTIAVTSGSRSYEFLKKHNPDFLLRNVIYLKKTGLFKI